ncbi:MAG TPA: hypothetical protein V6C81_29595 [Planktothrix sp.]
MKPALPEHPDVLIQGASIIATPLALIESETHKGPVNPNKIRAIPVVADALAVQGVAHANVWSAAMSGQQMSETAEFVHKYVRGAKAPRVLALFIAPLLFADVHEKSAADATFEQAFNRASHAIGIDWPRVHQWRQNIQLQIVLNTSRTYHALGLSEPISRQIEKEQSNYARFYAGPLDQKRLSYLRQILDECFERNVRVVLVSAPLAPANRALMKRWSYADYHRFIAGLADARCTFIDLGQSTDFTWPHDFDDPAHTNDPGGRKMISDVAPAIAKFLR